LLKVPNTTDDLLKLVRDVDIAAEGKVTVLYSSDLDVDGVKVSAADIAKEMAGDPDIGVINKTAASKLLESDDFLKVLRIRGLTPMALP
jgi:hypothetical protein